MRVGILTFHDAHNYGAVLQAYALKKYIKQLGHEARIINYHHELVPDGFLFLKEENPRRWKKFDEFIKELIDNDTQTYINEEELEKLDIDVWICGSDQIWNPELTNGFNKGFFLDFETNGKKVSYAASMGKLSLAEEYEESFKESINKLDQISVREDSLKLYAEKFTDKEVVKTLDPTLLLEEKDYNDLILEDNYGDYVLIYELVPDERLTKVAKEISKQKNVRIIELNDKRKDEYFCEQVSSASPEEFLSLMKNAKAIITNSFHGTVFSIIFQKEFYAISRENRNARVENILKIIEMEDRLIEKVEDLKNVKEQDYEKAYKKLTCEREKSQLFLKKALD